LITGLILLVIFGAVAVISYGAATSDCATYVYNGTEVNPSGCSADAGALGLAVIVIIIALILIILGAILKSKEAVPTALAWGAPPGPPLMGPGVPQIGFPAGAPAGKVCLRCGAYYAEPIPAFCSKCGGPVGSGTPPPNSQPTTGG
jgi:hypothetical protein